MNEVRHGDKTLTVKQAAKLVGVHKNTIYSLVQAKRLRAYRVGLGRGTIRIESADLPLVKRFNDRASDLSSAC